MKIKRRAAAVSLLATAALLLGACGDDDDDSADSGASGAAAESSAVECGSGAITGEGSSAQDNAIQEVIPSYTGECSGASVEYNATGSGAGRKQFIAGQVDFAGTDSALTKEGKDGAAAEVEAAAARCGSPAWHLPIVAGPIAVAYNVSGVDSISMPSAVIAKIFKGEITKWNDPAIAAANSGVTLPDANITVLYRSDDSGTTSNFTKFLQGSAPDVWTFEPAGVWASPAGEGRAQSAGVANGVAETPNSISYMEKSFADDRQLGTVAIDNGAGPVELTDEAAAKAVAIAKVDSSDPNDLRLKLDYATKEAGVYPAVLITYEVVCSKYSDPAKAENVKAFMKYYASADAQSTISEIGYAPLDDSLRQKIDTAIGAIS